MPDKSLTSFVAWWGAIVATLVFLWDIYKWAKSGPSIVVSAQPNMKTSVGAPQNLSGTNYVVVEAVNKGNKKTTITQLVSYHYSSIIKRILKKPSATFIVPDTGLAQRLPHVLEPGERWMGIIEQSKDLEKMTGQGYLYCGIYHALKARPVLQRVRIGKGT
jgi:hypothetical protein